MGEEKSWRRNENGERKERSGSPTLNARGGGFHRS